MLKDCTVQYEYIYIDLFLPHVTCNITNSPTCPFRSRVMCGRWYIICTGLSLGKYRGDNNNNNNKIIIIIITLHYLLLSISFT